MIDDIKLHYDDISIVPETKTTIKSRSECNPYTDDNMLPLFVAPMGSVIDADNWKEFYDNGINVVIPRTLPLDERLDILTKFRFWNMRNPFVALSLEETIEYFLTTTHMWELEKENSYMRVCIDLANGHMESLLETIKLVKDKYGKHVIIMAGNIANPETYTLYNEVGCDYVRCSIGTGSACLTASNTGIYYPPFSLIKEIYDIKVKCNGDCKIIADGGIKGFRDIQKALIYADYVMIGGLFNKCIESSSTTTYGKSWIKIKDFKFRNYLVDIFRYGKKIKREDYRSAMKLVRNGLLEVNKVFYGMSTKLAQTKTGHKTNLKTSEGIVKVQNVEYSLSQWVDNETSYLKSAMSYTNSRTLDEYKGSKWVIDNSITYNK